ncbi:response regulator receiver domain [uncultured Croceicoccus sp.]|uniref:response regulator receiver domain n=1 Tax=uncultured Croceicoccus sp. TaxID=1295329 RepID=UPI002631F21D|nr:response regulator receiver domain [uncultured Croceicoccus sp.]
MAEATYKDLVAEAFLSPIRSVLIVDDDYPTLHEILLSDSERKRQYGDKDWNRSSHSRARVRRVIEQFRGPGAPYMLDIHDGRSPSEETDEKKVGTLQQTDLLILDYILDKAKDDDGTASLRIAREALDNKHFNLILVHTKEDLDDVFTEFALGLLQPCFEQDGNDDPYESLGRVDIRFQP